LAKADSLPAGTSLTAMVIFAASGAASASLPPFTAERCFRTTLISSIEALDVLERLTWILRQFDQRRSASRNKKKDQRIRPGCLQKRQNRAGGLPTLRVWRRVASHKVAQPRQRG